MSVEEKQAAPTPAVQSGQQPAVAAPTIKAPRKRRRWPKVVIALVIVAALFGWFIVRPMMTATQQITNALYTPVQVERKDITVSVSGTATVEPNDAYQVTALVNGEILDAPFEEGDTVEEGALLYTIDSGDVQNSIQRAQIAVDQANLSYQDALDGEADLTVTASASGVITNLHVEEGDSLTMGGAVADIVDRDTVELKVPFHSQAAAQLSVGQTAQVTVSGTVETFNGTVTAISAADEVTSGGALVRTVTIELSNPGGITENDTGTASINGQACAGTGPFSYRSSKTVTASAAGDVSGLTVREGDRVTEGQVLCTLSGSSTESQIENARLNLESAQLSLQSAIDSLDSYTITSPISGTVVEKNFKAGDKLESAASGYLAVIYDLSSLKLEMAVDELYIGQIQVGQTVKITAEALEGQTFTGTVSRININGTTLNGVTSYPVTITIEEPGDLLPGMNVNAEILVEHAEDVLAVPVSAVQRGNTVLIPGEGAIGKDGSIDPSKLVEQGVTLGRNDEDYIEITGGLSEGDTVVVRQEISSIMDLMMSMSEGGSTGTSGTAVVAAGG